MTTTDDAADRATTPRRPDARVTVIVPVYNERNTLRDLLDRVRAQRILWHGTSIPIDVVVVDDCSNDGGVDFLDGPEGHALYPEVSLVRHARNRGKGAAIRTGLGHVSGTIVIVQDADLEYDPQEYPILMDPIEKGRADVVFGSRFIGAQPHRVVYFWHMMGNRFLTLLSNMFTNLNLTDMETCYKLFRREVIQSIEIEEARFGFEPEITAKVAAMGCRIYEVGISYYGRTYAEGKKIGWKDGFRAIYCILKYNLLRKPAKKFEVPTTHQGSPVGCCEAKRVANGTSGDANH